MPEIPEYENILVPVKHPDDVNRVTELGSVLLNRGRITFLTVIKKGSFYSVQKDWRISTQAIEKHRERITNKRIRVIPKIRYSENVWKGVLDQAEEDDSDLILMGWGKNVTFRSIGQTPVERIFANSNRDVIAFRNQTDSVKNIQKVLFPVGYKGYDYRKRLTVTSRMIKNIGAEVVFTHIFAEDSEEEAEEILQGPKEFMLDRGIDCETKTMKHHDVSKALIEESKNYDLIILGPTKEYVFSRYLFGWMTDKIVNNVGCSALVFKEGEQRWKAWARGTIDAFKRKVKSIFR